MSKWTPNDRTIVRFMIEQADHHDKNASDNEVKVNGYEVSLETLVSIMHPDPKSIKVATNATWNSLKRLFVKTDKLGLGITRVSPLGPGQKGVYHIPHDVMNTLRELNEGWRRQEYVWRNARHRIRK